MLVKAWENYFWIVPFCTAVFNTSKVYPLLFYRVCSCKLLSFFKKRTNLKQDIVKTSRLSGIDTPPVNLQEIPINLKFESSFKILKPHNKYFFSFTNGTRNMVIYKIN